jgi:hypothetical protein
MNIFTQVFVDTFQRPDEDPLNPAAYSVDPGSDAFALVSHAAVSSAAAIADGEVATAAFIGAVLSNDAYSEVTISAAAGVIIYEAFLRNDGNNETGFSCFFEDAFPGSPVFTISDPSDTPIASGPVAVTFGDVLRFWCLGTTFGFDVNGVNKLVGTSSAATIGTTATLVGDNFNEVQSDLQFSRFAFGNVTSSGGGGGGNNSGGLLKLLGVN